LSRWWIANIRTISLWNYRRRTRTALDEDSSVFIYGGLPGEPAFGPPAFMHRMSAMDSPEAPLTHHWFDSTHITFGVLTAGVTHGDWKFEGSRFRGREPDEDRYDIETGELDSSSLRVSWNPTANWSFQASWADITSPEALEPDEDEERWSVSGIYTQPLAEYGLVVTNDGVRQQGAERWHLARCVAGGSRLASE
jgi:hypothetical protein